MEGLNCPHCNAPNLNDRVKAEEYKGSDEIAMMHPRGYPSTFGKPEVLLQLMQDPGFAARVGMRMSHPGMMGPGMGMHPGMMGRGMMPPGMGMPPGMMPPPGMFRKSLWETRK
jgi:hypothetical protein